MIVQKIFDMILFVDCSACYKCILKASTLDYGYHYVIESIIVVLDETENQNYCRLLVGELQVGMEIVT